MFVTNCWYVAGWSHDFNPGTLYGRLIINQPILLYRKSDGTPVAIENRCVHRHAPLSLGCLEEDSVRCGYHGFKFAPDGRCVEIPGQDSVPSNARVRAYPVVEKHSWLWVWMGDPTKADERYIPPAVGFEDPRWCLKSGWLDFEASHRLINDNLTDLSHLSFTHKNSFGAGLHWVLIKPTVVNLDRGVRVSRWVTDPTPTYVRDYSEPNVDQMIEYDYLVPGIFLLHTAVYPEGTAARLKSQGEERPAALWETFSCQAVTPMTATTTRYFFSWGPSSVHGSESDAEVMFKIAQRAFAEDKAMIEGQQKIIDLEPERQILPTRADLASITFDRLMNKLMAADSAG